MRCSCSPCRTTPAGQHHFIFRHPGRFFAWGLWPLFLKPLHGVDALQVCAWRAILGCSVGFVWLALRKETNKAWQTVKDRAVVLRLIATAMLLIVNWAVYIWAIANHQVVSSSLGYFINPLINVLFGLAFLNERLRRVQWLSVAIAACVVRQARSRYFTPADRHNTASLTPVCFSARIALPRALGGTLNCLIACLIAASASGCS